MHEYAALEAIDRERDFETRKAFFDAAEKAADRRAGLVAAMILNVNRRDADAKIWQAVDFFPSLKGEEKEPEEMTTEATVDYLRRGFGLIVPTAFRQRVGLPD